MCFVTSWFTISAPFAPRVTITVCVLCASNALAAFSAGGNILDWLVRQQAELAFIGNDEIGKSNQLLRQCTRRSGIQHDSQALLFGPFRRREDWLDGIPAAAEVICNLKKKQYLDPQADPAIASGERTMLFCPFAPTMMVAVPLRLPHRFERGLYPHHYV